MSEAATNSKDGIAKKRRNYLARRVGALSIVAVSGLISGIGFAAATLIAIWVVVSAVNFGWYAVALLIVAIVPAIICLAIAIAAWMGCWRARIIAASIPYVPPEREQVEFRPAVEILVRGSEQPPTAPDELLRAAQDGKSIPADELMRPTESALP